MKINNNPSHIQTGEIKFREPAKQADAGTKDIISLGNSEQPDNTFTLKELAGQKQKKSGEAGKIAFIAGGSLLAGAAIGGTLVTLPMALLGLSTTAAGITGGFVGLAAGTAIMSGFFEDGTTCNNAPVGLPLNPDQYNAGDFGLPRDPDDPLYGT